MSAAVETHIDKALASLEDLSAKELDVAADKLGRRRHGGLVEFGHVFRDFVLERDRASWADPRRHLEQAVSRADEELAAQIAHAPAPFWRHVRDALAERYP